MAVSATVIGALLGLGTQMYSNALRKLPYMRRAIHFLSFFFYLFMRFISFLISNPRLGNLNSKSKTRNADPWEHLLGMGLGAVFVNQLVIWDAQLQRDLDQMLEKAKAANERRYFGR
ncbi:Detected protein of confused Function [Hibiscus syriacus]|uniref:Detected protein of confused Function n=1 Tax=Hibiscus syriacus TaxID=106335 RepID=A0A6A2Y7W2_HIBSY|nr:Detected protein of confused Function [Hibiscus syriacus]